MSKDNNDLAEFILMHMSRMGVTADDALTSLCAYADPWSDYANAAADEHLELRHQIADLVTLGRQAA